MDQITGSVVYWVGIIFSALFCFSFIAYYHTNEHTHTHQTTDAITKVFEISTKISMRSKDLYNGVYYVIKWESLNQNTAQMNIWSAIVMDVIAS